MVQNLNYGNDLKYLVCGVVVGVIMSDNEEITFTRMGRYYKICRYCGSIIETDMNGELIND